MAQESASMHGTRPVHSAIERRGADDVGFWWVMAIVPTTFAALTVALLIL